ncbi:MAG: MBL fold metallo-hydrolase [Polyangiales bacterium]
MRVKLWGTRGSLPTPGPDTSRFGGNTSCVEVRADDNSVLVLDAGTGIRNLGRTIPGTCSRVDVLISHLHMDHIQGMGFFAPFYVPGLEVHIWGPASPLETLRARLGRYMSPPLFPVRLRDLPCNLTVHEVPSGAMRIGPFTVEASLVCHPGPTVGYRISEGARTLAYLPDHEPALGVRGSLLGHGWTSGQDLAREVDLLIHDAQYTNAQYDARVGWGHTTFERAVEFAELSRAERLVLFHHDPDHDDATLASLVSSLVKTSRASMPITAGFEGEVFDL